MRRLTTICGLMVAAAALFASAAPASPSVRYGIQDDAWLLYGPGTLTQRLDLLQSLGVDVVRLSLHWNDVAPTQPARALSATDPAYRWAGYDTVLDGLHARGITPVVTLLGTPSWANGGSRPNVAPSDGTSFGDFAYAAAKRYPYVRNWTVWNEPNQRLGLSVPSARLYVSRLLNPAYVAIHRANAAALVAGGVTAPRGNSGGVAPLAWILGMKAAHAKLDAYAHHPYPAHPTVESPFSGACSNCDTITMANLDRLLKEVRRDFGAKPVWLTEYGYQTNPPDPILGVSPGLQATYISEAALRAYREPGVTMLVNFLVRDEPGVGRFQSGLFTAGGAPKPSAQAFPFPLAQVTRAGSGVVLWGQVRPRSGAQPYRLQVKTGGAWRWAGGTAQTNSLGFFSRTIAAPRGTLVRSWSPRDRAFGWPIVVR